MRAYFLALSLAPLTTLACSSELNRSSALENIDEIASEQIFTAYQQMAQQPILHEVTKQFGEKLWTAPKGYLNQSPFSIDGLKIPFNRVSITQLTNATKAFQRKYSNRIAYWQSLGLDPHAAISQFDFVHGVAAMHRIVKGLTSKNEVVILTKEEQSSLQRLKIVANAWINQKNYDRGVEPPALSLLANKPSQSKTQLSRAQQIADAITQTPEAISYNFLCQPSKDVKASDHGHMPALYLTMEDNKATVNFPGSAHKYTGTPSEDSNGSLVHYDGFHYEQNGENFGDLGEFEANFDVSIDRDLSEGHPGRFIVRYQGQSRKWWDLYCEKLDKPESA